MRKEFIRKIGFYGVYDTRKYRYRCCDGVIYRIAKDLLNTTGAINGWKIVYTGK